MNNYDQLNENNLQKIAKFYTQKPFTSMAVSVLLFLFKLLGDKK
jgi:hypothetical protein